MGISAKKLESAELAMDDLRRLYDGTSPGGRGASTTPPSGPPGQARFGTRVTRARSEIGMISIVSSRS